MKFLYFSTLSMWFIILSPALRAPERVVESYVHLILYLGILGLGDIEFDGSSAMCTGVVSPVRKKRVEVILDLDHTQVCVTMFHGPYLKRGHVVESHLWVHEHLYRVHQ